MDDQNQTASTDTPADGGDKPVDSGTGTIFAPATADPSVNPYDLTSSGNSTPAIGTPPPVFAQPTAPTDAPTAPNIGSAPLNASPAAPEADKPATTASLSPASTSDLESIKQQALQSLTPLVDDLPQTPEDKFKTVMMLIQASDNSSLIKKAYDAAGAITDEKARAQALLDVVNEINYFTQPKPDETPKT